MAGGGKIQGETKRQDTAVNNQALACPARLTLLEEQRLQMVV
jgi:hypothetical protein